MDLRRGQDGGYAPGTELRCDYLDKDLNGWSPKFACLLPSGKDIKVKYGPANGEVHGEVAATRLLWALGFGADGMYPVRVICGGCPDTIGMPTGRSGERLVDPAVVEVKMAGRELASGDQAGWSWLELDLIDEEAGGATLAQRDALKLLAVFMQHTDSKPEQQRLVCLDPSTELRASPEESPGAPCERPFMLINDVGLTFGRANLLNRNVVGSVNLQEWSRTPVWKDDRACVGNLPRSLTGTLKDPVISEDGRQFLAERLMQLSDTQLRTLFDAARMDIREATPGVPSIDQWVAAFKAKRQEIVDRRCDVLWPGGIAALAGTAPIRWLQDRGSEGLTIAMNSISLFGYTRVHLAIAVALAFLINLRAGAALLLLLALNGVITDGAKAIVASPRPHAVDAAVQNLDVVETLGASFRSGAVTPSVDTDDGYGFPSGHVAVTTAFFLGLGYFFQWRWVWPAMAVCIPLMALSRLYLGRHFVGDVLGGVGVGVIAATIGFLVLTLARLSNPKRANDPAARAVIVAGGCALAALGSGFGAYDAGRFLGLAAGVMLLVYDQSLAAGLAHGRAADKARLGVRVGRVALAAAAFAAVWLGTNAALEAMEMLHTPAGALLAGAVPAFALLPAPLYLEQLISAAAGRVSAAVH
jgi:membrane-associated phospholipid phosphatase